MHPPPTNVGRVQEIPGVDAICGLSLLLVRSFAPRGFSPGTPVFPSPLLREVFLRVLRYSPLLCSERFFSGYSGTPLSFAPTGFFSGYSGTPLSFAPRGFFSGYSGTPLSFAPRGFSPGTPVLPSPLLREVFLRVLRFSPLLKNQHFQISIRSGTHGHI